MKKHKKRENWNDRKSNEKDFCYKLYFLHQTSYKKKLRKKRNKKMCTRKSFRFPTIFSFLNFFFLNIVDKKNTSSILTRKYFKYFSSKSLLISIPIKSLYHSININI